MQANLFLNTFGGKDVTLEQFGYNGYRDRIVSSPLVSLHDSNLKKSSPISFL
jgi:hypothetical protein